MTFALTAKQEEANQLLGGKALHTLLRGGSRSGKTTLIVRGVITRGLAHKSRHLIARFRFNHIKSSIVYDTLPKVMAECFPGVADHCHLDKSDWFYTLPNGSEIWFGGLDDKERTEKVLGNEYATVVLNECSQIPWQSRNIAISRLAQKTPLRLRAWYDENPPDKGHWTYQLFMRKVSPDRGTALLNPDNYATMQLNPRDNLDNLPTGYIAELNELPERLRLRFAEGQFGEHTIGALWTLEGLDAGREFDLDINTIGRVVVAVDPSGTKGEEDTRSDEVGIVVVGITHDGKKAYVLDDLSGQYPAEGDGNWGQVAVKAYDDWSASLIVGEVNFGGAMVRAVVRAVRAGVPFKEVRASKGKHIRAEPISYLFGDGRCALAGRFPLLENQLAGMTTSGYKGSKSPDRADACIWGFHELFPMITKKEPGKFPVPPPRALPFGRPPGPQDWMLE